jgi:hypothetical protein
VPKGEGAFDDPATPGNDLAGGDLDERFTSMYRRFDFRRSADRIPRFLKPLQSFGSRTKSSFAEGRNPLKTGPT